MSGNHISKKAWASHSISGLRNQPRPSSIISDIPSHQTLPWSQAPSSVLRLTVRSNVEPKCGNNSSESLHVFLCSCVYSFQPKFLYRLRTGTVRCICLSITIKDLRVQLLVVSNWLWPRLSKWSQMRSQGFEVDSLSPEVVTANQRACEVRVRDWVESQGTVITRWLGKNKLT